MATCFRRDAEAASRPCPPPPVPQDPASPGLPEGLWRDTYVEHVIEVLGAAMPPAAGRVLRYYARLTSPGDWGCAGDGPVCWARQVQAAEALGLSDRAVRAAEARLEDLGLIERRCGANGGRRPPLGEAVPPLGLAFAPMIRRSGGILRTLRERCIAAEDLECLRRRVSRLRFHLRGLARRAGDSARAREALEYLATLPRRLSRGRDGARLEEIADRLGILCERIGAEEPARAPDGAPDAIDADGPEPCGADSAPESGGADHVPSGTAPEESGEESGETSRNLLINGCCAPICSGRAEQAFRSHIYTTSKTLKVDCTAAADRDEAGRDPGGAQQAPDRPADCAPDHPAGRQTGRGAESGAAPRKRPAAPGGGAGERDRGSGAPPAPPKPVPWTLEQLRDAASGVFRAGLDARRGLDGRLGERDFHDVARERAGALGIRPDLWGHACAVIGRAEAALALLVLDAHAGAPPVAPIDSPPAYFREMIARGQDGTLRLDAAIFAILRRTGAQSLH